MKTKNGGGLSVTIDFHNHVFPDSLAKRAMSALYENIDGLYTPRHDGTVSGLLKKMDETNVDVSVVLPVITKPSQLKTTNEWAADICSERIVCFGGIYPHTGDYKRDIDYVAGLGLKGLKFHAEYQEFALDDAHMLKIYDYALSKGLILIHHAGFNPGFPAPFRSSPAQFLNVVNAMRGGVIVAAHFGGHAQWDEVERVLAGSGIYLDTSMGFEYFDHAQFMRIVKKHGASKILFASDSPWSDSKQELETLRALPLPKSDVEAIAGNNAARLLFSKGY
jgi:predicted TIM-barrel fold metal-dependent hydrolase